MRLTKDSKYVLDILIANPPLGNSNTYNVIAWMGVIDEKKIHSYSDYTGMGAVAFAKAGEVLRGIIRMFYIRARQIKVYSLCLLSTRI